MSLVISPDTAGPDAANAHFDTASSYGWIEFGLSRETVVTFVADDVTLILANYDAQVTADELVALAQSVQPVDDETWTERLTVAPLFDAPVGTGPPDE